MSGSGWLRQAAVAGFTLHLGLAMAAEPVNLSGQSVPLNLRIEAAARYLHAQIEPDGRMTYRRDAVTGQVIAGRYNVLRHAGTLLALAEFHLEQPPDPAQAAAIHRSFDFLRRCCFAAAGEGAQGTAVWSPPDLVGGRRDHAIAKLGGAGLALSALSQWRRVAPDRVPIEEMRALGRFILSMQSQDGTFRSLHSLPPARHNPDWVSLYYPGEAALGLILLFEHDPDTAWLAAAIDALRALARGREGMSEPPPDHWALLATHRLWQQPVHAIEAALPDGFSWWPAPTHTAAAPLLLAHAESIARSLMRAQNHGNAHPCVRGAFTPDGRSTPTATRLEGLLALHGFMPEGPSKPALKASIDAGLSFLQQAQWTQGRVAGGFPRVSAACPAVDERSREVRIDDVQHALAAMLAWRSRFLPR